LTQEVSSFTVEKITGSNEGIVVSKTEAQTNLVVQSGQTIIIGGSSEKTAVTGVQAFRFSVKYLYLVIYSVKPTRQTIAMN
jgi:type II secretory pathway component HofQ